MQVALEAGGEFAKRMTIPTDVHRGRASRTGIRSAFNRERLIDDVRYIDLACSSPGAHAGAEVEQTACGRCGRQRLKQGRNRSKARAAGYGESRNPVFG